MAGTRRGLLLAALGALPFVSLRTTAASGNLGEALIREPADSSRNTVTVDADKTGLGFDVTGPARPKHPTQLVRLSGDYRYVWAAQVGNDDWQDAAEVVYLWKEAGGRWFIGAAPRLGLNDVIDLYGPDGDEPGFAVFTNKGIDPVEPDLSTIQEGQWIPWMDVTPGASKLNIVGRDANNTLVRASIPLVS